MVWSWLFASFLFKPAGFEWHKIVEDWGDRTKWIYEYDCGGMNVPSYMSWESWWGKNNKIIDTRGNLLPYLRLFEHYVSSSLSAGSCSSVWVCRFLFSL